LDESQGEQSRRKAGTVQLWWSAWSRHHPRQGGQWRTASRRTRSWTLRGRTPLPPRARRLSSSRHIAK